MPIDRVMNSVKDKSILFHLFVVMILDLLAFTCILPLFPSLMDFYGSKSKPGDIYDVVATKMSSFQNLIDVPQNYRYHSVLFGGFLGSMFSFLQFLSSPIFGAFSDVFGRKKLLLISVTGSTVSYMVWANADTFGAFMISRFIGGLSKASVSIFTAIVADVMPTKSRGKGMVLIGVAFSIGFICGPMIGAYFAHKNRTDITRNNFSILPPYFAIVLSLIEICWILLFIPETAQQASESNEATAVLSKVIEYISPRSLLWAGQRSKTPALTKVQGLTVVNFSFLLIYSGLEFTLTFFAHLFFAYDSMQQGRLYFFIGLLMVVFQSGYARRVTADKQEMAASMGIISVSLSFFLIGIAALLQAKLLFYSSLLCFSFGSATVVTCLTTAVSAEVSEFEQGTVMGIFRSASALARALGPFLASAVFWIFGPSICYLFGGIAMLVPLSLLRLQQETNNAVLNVKTR